MLFMSYYIFLKSKVQMNIFFMWNLNIKMFCIIKLTNMHLLMIFYFFKYIHQFNFNIIQHFMHRFYLSKISQVLSHCIFHQHFCFLKIIVI